MLLTAEPVPALSFLDTNSQRYHSCRSGGSIFLCAGKLIMCLYTSMHAVTPDTNPFRGKYLLAEKKKCSGGERSCAGVGSGRGDLPPFVSVWSRAIAVLAVVGGSDASSSAERGKSPGLLCWKLEKNQERAFRSSLLVTM